MSTIHEGWLGKNVAVAVVVVDVGVAAVVVGTAGKGKVATIRVNFAEVGGNDCSPTPVALTLILTPIAITLAVTLTLVRAKFGMGMCVGAVGWG